MTPVYSPDCDCYLGVGISGLSLIHFKTDKEACDAYVNAYVSCFSKGTTRYYLIHGPGGHLIGVKDTPYYDLPLHMTWEQATAKSSDS